MTSGLFKPKIFVLHGKGGCDYWRTWLPMEEMRKQGLADIRYLEVREANGKKIGEGIHWADVTFIRGLIGTDGLSTLRQYHALGAKIATDYDDLHFNVSPFNPAYKYFGIDNVEVLDPTTGDKKMLWKDGEEGFDIKRNKITFHAYKAILEEVDLITTTTLYLKGAIAEIGGREDNIRVLPNAIDLTQWKPLDIRSKFSDTFRFGWSVSNSHFDDWMFIKDTIKAFLISHPDAKFVCLGDTNMDIKTFLPPEQVEWYPFSDLWEGHYPMRMAMLGLDAAIAPLANTEFNKCKSPLKWAEYTAFGYPVIAQDMTPYKEHIISGETGILADTKEQWLLALNQLYTNKELRYKLRFNALCSVNEMFNLKNVAQEWADVFKDLIYGKVNKSA